MQNKPTHVLIHCSDSTWGNAAEITKWHKARGWTSIGYHFVVLNGRPGLAVFDGGLDGVVEAGRPVTAVGAHCPPYNARSVAICLIGKGGKFSPAQLPSAYQLAADLCKQFSIPEGNVIGHREADPASGKTCPDLDMDTFRANVGARLKGVL